MRRLRIITVFDTLRPVQLQGVDRYKEHSLAVKGGRWHLNGAPTVWKNVEELVLRASAAETLRELDQLGGAAGGSNRELVVRLSRHIQSGVPTQSVPQSPDELSPADASLWKAVFGKWHDAWQADVLFVLPVRCPGAAERQANDLREKLSTAAIAQLDAAYGRGPAPPPFRLSFLFVRTAPPPKPEQETVGAWFELRRCLIDDLINHVTSDPTGVVRQGRQAARKTDQCGPVLLSGPSGVGKSAAARALYRDQRFSGKFISVNVAAIQASLLEARLRGHVSGAFTGAKQREGWFELAHNGVLFLDEFQLASKELQGQLLDLLSATSNDVSVSRLGEEEVSRRCNVQVVLALNEEIQQLLETKRLRSDLLHRMQRVVTFSSLRSQLCAARGTPQRHGPLPALARIYRWRYAEVVEETAASAQTGDERSASLHARTFFPEFEDSFFDALERKNWPGNFRQLERVLASVFRSSDAEQRPLLEASAAEEAIRDAYGAWVLEESTPVASPPASTAEQERVRAVEQVLRAKGFVIAAASKDLEKFRLKTRSTLKGFVVRYQAEFSAETQRDPDFQAILSRRPQTRRARRR